MSAVVTLDFENAPFLQRLQQMSYSVVSFLKHNLTIQYIQSAKIYRLLQFTAMLTESLHSLNSPYLNLQCNEIRMSFHVLYERKSVKWKV